MDFEKLKSFRNINNNFAKLLGIELTELSDGYAKATMKVTKDFLNPIGSLHGGCLYTIADIVGGAAASSYGIHVTTIDGNFHYLRAGINTKELSATATEIKKGKKISVYSISVKDQDSVELAVGIFSFMSLGKAIEI